MSVCNIWPHARAVCIDIIITLVEKGPRLRDQQVAVFCLSRDLSTSSPKKESATCKIEPVFAESDLIQNNPINHGQMGLPGFTPFPKVINIEINPWKTSCWEI